MGRENDFPSGSWRLYTWGDSDLTIVLQRSPDLRAALVSFSGHLFPYQLFCFALLSILFNNFWSDRSVSCRMAWLSALITIHGCQAFGFTRVSPIFQPSIPAFSEMPKCPSQLLAQCKNRRKGDRQNDFFCVCVKGGGGIWKKSNCLVPIFERRKK